MRYFDKTFFRFTLGFLVIIAISLMIMYAASAYASGVEKIIFTTDSQSIKPNTLSSALTIQTQDSGDNVFQTPETLDIQFISTSPSGEFLSSAGNPATTYMSKNTANKTFYYKDPTEGNYTITINVRGRDTGIELETSQPITVSAGASENTNISGEVQSASTEASVGGTGGSTTNVSSLNAQLEILAGNDRTTVPGSPIWFQATLKKNTTGLSPELNWSFGDGNVAVGALVSHTYKYTGDYVVVLSTRAGDVFSVSRLKVKVSQSDMIVSDKGEYLEITNKSNNEINLFNWKIESGGKGFIFQPNTIILPKSVIKLDKSFLRMKGLDNSQGIALKNAIGEMVFALAPILPAEKINTIEIFKNVENKIVNTDFQNKELETPVVSAENPNVPNENVIYEVPTSPSLVARLTNFIKRVFSK